jgi:type I restriction enzyme S subunit
MSWRTYKFGDFLHRSKISIDIEDNKEYKRVTIKTKHQGVSVRDSEKGKKIGTKKQFVLKAGQFVLSKIDARYGAFGIAPDEVEGAIITGNFWAYDVDFSIINIEWFNKFTNSQDFYDVCERASSGITHRKYLNEVFFLNYEIELPSVNEQLEIVEEFKKIKIILEDQATQLTHQLDLVKQLRQAFLREAMQGKLVPQDPNDEPASVLLEKIKAEKERLIKEGKIKKQKPLPPITAEEIPFEIPENWVWCKIGDISSSIVPNRDKPKSFSGTIPWITQTNFSEKSIKLDYSVNDIGLNLEEIKKYNCRVMPKGSIVMSCVGRFDLVCFIDKDIVANQQLHCFTPIIKTMSMYLVYGIKLLNIEVAKTAIHTTIKYLNKTKIESIPIPLPPLSEQQRIVSQLDELMQYCDALEASIKASQQQNELLLQQVLREALEPKKMKA